MKDKDLPIIDKTTPHLFIWFTDGKKLGKDGNLIISEDGLPLPNHEPLNYLERLKTECAKLKKTRTPVYLAYSGRMLSNGQKAAMEALAHQPDFENLMVLDYDEVEKRMDGVQGAKIAAHNPIEEIFIIKTIDVSRDEILKVTKELLGYWMNDFYNPYHSPKPLAMQSAIDSTRLVLLYYSDIVRQIAEEKYQDKKAYINDQLSHGILYRDFDVQLKSSEASDIVTNNGCISSLNCEEIFNKWLGRFPDKESEVRKFAESYLFDIGSYSRTVEDLHKISKGETLPEDTMERLVFIESVLRKIHPSGGDKDFDPKNFKSSLFYKLFVKDVYVENSLIAFNEDRHSVAASLMAEVFRKKTSACSSFTMLDPYAAVKRWIRVDQGINGEKVLSNPEVGTAGFDTIIQNLKVLQVFSIGNDLTWNDRSSDVDASQKKQPSPSPSSLVIAQLQPVVPQIMPPS